MSSKSFLDEGDFVGDEQWPVSPSGSNPNYSFQYSDPSAPQPKYSYPPPNNFLFNPVVSPPPYAQQGRVSTGGISTINDQSKWQVNQLPLGGEQKKSSALIEPASSVPKSRKPKKVVEQQQILPPPPPPSTTLTEDNEVVQKPIDNKFQCALCLKYFGTKGSLKTHTRVHTGERPFPCPVNGCTRAFTQQANCTRHVKLIHKDFSLDMEPEEKEEEKKKGRKKKEEAKRSTAAPVQDVDETLIPPVHRVNTGTSAPSQREEHEITVALQEFGGGTTNALVTNFSSSSSTSSSSSYADGPILSVPPLLMQKQSKKKGRPSNNADKSSASTGARKKIKKSSKAGEIESGRLTIQSAQQPPMFGAIDGYAVRSYPGHNLGHHVYQINSPVDEFHNEQRLFSPVPFEFDPPSDHRATSLQPHHDHNYIAANTQSPSTYNGYHPMHPQMYFYGPNQMNAFNFNSLASSQVNHSNMLASPPPSHSFQPFFDNFLPEETTFDLQHS